MTGEELLRKLQEMTPEERRLTVYREETDRDQWSDFTPCYRVGVLQMPDEYGEQQALVIS